MGGVTCIWAGQLDSEYTKSWVEGDGVALYIELL